MGANTLGDYSEHRLSIFNKERYEAFNHAQKLERERERDRLIADAEAHHALADMHMPDDLRAQAKIWGLEHFMDAVWRAGWQSGFRVGVKRHEAKQDT